jgi:undecaprenyl-diphosphatase
VRPEKSPETRFPWPALLIGFLLPLALFTLTALHAAGSEGSAFERSLLLFINGFATPSLDRFMVTATDLGGPLLMALLTLLLSLVLWLRRHYWQAVFLFLAVGGASAINYLIKPLFGRERPDLWLSPVPETTFGFPSGHSIASMSLCVGLILLSWPTRWRWPVAAVAVPFALLIAFSRLYLGVHYPSDVLAGWLVGAAWTVGLYLVFRTLRRLNGSPGGRVRGVRS